MVAWEIRDTQISMSELMAPVIAFDALATRLRGRTVLLLIDSEPVQAALIKLFSSHEDHCDLVSVFWDICVEHDISVYICRVPTDANFYQSRIFHPSIHERLPCRRPRDSQRIGAAALV